jgi:FkbM family methyltransferase
MHADRPVLPVADGAAPALHVYATPAAERLVVDGAVRVDRATVEWLEREVALGDVVYDIGAGIGEYVLLAAKRRGAIVVAFEPGYAAYGYLCDNVLLNGCEASVVPIPLALAARDGLAEIKYQQGQPGEPEYMVRDDIDWRVKHRGRNRPYLQPAVLARLDTVVERYRIPAPNHIRVSPLMVADQVMAGATATLAMPSLKTICVQSSTPGETLCRTLHRT